MVTVTSGAAKRREKERELYDPGIRAACIKEGAYPLFLSFFSLCCHSLFSTVPAGEGSSAVPGLVTCPSIPQGLRQGHCDRNGDCENRTRKGDRGTVFHAV